MNDVKTYQAGQHIQASKFKDQTKVKQTLVITFCNPVASVTVETLVGHTVLSLAACTYYSGYASTIVIFPREN